MADGDNKAAVDIWEQEMQGLPVSTNHGTAKEVFEAVRKLSDTPEAARIAHMIWHIESHPKNGSHLAMTRIRSSRPYTLEDLVCETAEDLMSPAIADIFRRDFTEEYRYFGETYNRRENYEYFTLSDLPSKEAGQNAEPQPAEAEAQKPAEAEVQKPVEAEAQKSEAQQPLDPWEQAKEGLFESQVEPPYVHLNDYLDRMKMIMGDTPENARVAHSLWKVGTNQVFGFNSSAISDLANDMIGPDEFFEQILKTDVLNNASLKQGLGDIKDDVRFLINRWNDIHPDDLLEMPGEAAEAEVQPQPVEEKPVEANAQPQPAEAPKPAEVPAEEPLDPWEKAKKGTDDNVFAYTRDNFFDLMKRELGDNAANAELSRNIWKILSTDELSVDNGSLINYREGLIETVDGIIEALVKKDIQEKFFIERDLAKVRDEVRFVVNRWNEMHPEDTVAMPGEPAAEKEVKVVEEPKPMEAEAQPQPVEAPEEEPLDPWEKAQENLKDEIFTYRKDDFFDFMKSNLENTQENINLTRAIWKVATTDQLSDLSFAFADMVFNKINTVDQFMSTFVEQDIHEKNFVQHDFNDVKDEVQLIVNSWNAKHPEKPAYMPGEPKPEAQAAPKGNEAHRDAIIADIKEVKLIGELNEAIRQKENENASQYEKRVYDELVELMAGGKEKIETAAERVMDIQLFVMKDTVKDNTHKAAENVLKNFKDHLYSKVNSEGAPDPKGVENLEAFAKAAGAVFAKYKIETGIAKQEMEENIREGKIGGTEILNGTDDNSIKANNDAIRSVGDAIVEATNENYLRARAIHTFMVELEDRVENISVGTKSLDNVLMTQYDNASKAYVYSGTKAEQGVKLKNYGRGALFTGDAEKYGYVINKKAAEIGQPIFSKYPEEVLAQNKKYGISTGKGITENSIAYADNLVKVVEEIATESQKKLNDLERIKKSGANNKEYTALKKALEALIQLPNKNYTAEQALAKMNNLKNTAEIYYRTHNHWWKGRSGVGSHRLSKSNELKNFANNYLSNMSIFRMNIQRLSSGTVTVNAAKDKKYMSNVPINNLKEILKESQRRYEVASKKKLVKQEELNKNQNEKQDTVDYHRMRVDIRAAKANKMELNANENGMNK